MGTGPDDAGEWLFLGETIQMRVAAQEHVFAGHRRRRIELVIEAIG